jgi:hypothetical protein
MTDPTERNEADVAGLVEREWPQVYPDSEGGLVREFLGFAKVIKDNPPMEQRKVSVRLVLAVAARIAELEAEVAAAREALEPFAKAAMGVETFDPDYPMDGAALRASFDWYDKAQGGPLKRHSVRRSDLARARAFLARNTDGGGK